MSASIYAIGAIALGALILLSRKKPSVRPGGLIIVGGGRPREPFPWGTLLIIGGGLAYAWWHYNNAAVVPHTAPYYSVPQVTPTPRHDAYRSNGRA